MLWTAWWKPSPDFFLLQETTRPPPFPSWQWPPDFGCWGQNSSSLTYTAELLFMFQMREMNDNVFENGSLYTQHLKCIGSGNSYIFLTLLIYSKKLFYVRLNKAKRQKHLKPNFPFLCNAPHDSNGCRNLCFVISDAIVYWIISLLLTEYYEAEIQRLSGFFMKSSSWNASVPQNANFLKPRKQTFV